MSDKKIIEFPRAPEYDTKGGFAFKVPESLCERELTEQEKRGTLRINFTCTPGPGLAKYIYEDSSDEDLSDEECIPKSDDK